MPHRRIPRRFTAMGAIWASGVHTAGSPLRWQVLMRLPPLGLPQHPDKHRPERPVLLAVDHARGHSIIDQPTIDQPTSSGFTSARSARRWSS
jgi:hypothetical protein